MSVIKRNGHAGGLGGRTELGAIAIPFVIAFITIASLFGMLTEGSLVLHARHKLFDGAEQAVLAGANLYQSQFNLDCATTSKQDQLLSLVKTSYCSDNFLDASNTTLDFSQISSNILTINSSKSVNVLFFKNALTLNCQLSVSVPQPANGLTGVAPLAMYRTDYVAGASYTIKQGGGDKYTAGNYGALALSGNGASDYESDFKNGYSGTISVGDVLNVKTGNMSGPTDDSVNYRIANGTDEVLIVLTDAFPKGSGTITVVGFAAFRVTSSSQGSVTGTFITYKVKAASTTTGNYGVYTHPKLLFN